MPAMFQLVVCMMCLAATAAAHPAPRGAWDTVTNAAIDVTQELGPAVQAGQIVPTNGGAPPSPAQAGAPIPTPGFQVINAGDPNFEKNRENAEAEEIKKYIPAAAQTPQSQTQPAFVSAQQQQQQQQQIQQQQFQQQQFQQQHQQAVNSLGAMDSSLVRIDPVTGLPRA